MRLRDSDWTFVALVLALATVLVFAGIGAVNGQDYKVVFKGEPTLKVDAGQGGVSIWPVAEGDAEDLAAEIVVDDQGNYYWSSRGMVPMFKTEAGVYVTFHAAGGYIRTYKDEYLVADRRAGNLVGTEGREYTEHLRHGLASINYYGRRVDR